MTPHRARTLNASVLTERLVLEPITTAHADVLFPQLGNEAVYRWISVAPPTSVDQLRSRLTVLESRLSPGRDEAWLNWAVRRAVDGTYVGKFDASVDGANVATNVGYLFFPDFWGHGYATEAVRGVVAHLARHDVTELRALVTSGNDASARVLIKAGFVRTRTLPDNDIIRGVKCDDVEYVILA